METIRHKHKQTNEDEIIIKNYLYVCNAKNVELIKDNKKKKKRRERYKK
jgi:hypothetical protein